MRKTRSQFWMGAVGTVTLGMGLAAFSPSRAEACGGLFCAQVPVVQTGETIIFTSDHERKEVNAVIRINYSGAAEDFAWLLPLQRPPVNNEIRVGSAWSFVIAQQLTAPRFQITEVIEDGVCGLGGGGVLARSTGDFDASGPAPASAESANDVNVLARRDVGPYESVILQGTDDGAIRTWLTDNGFRVTDTMMEAVVPYIAKGDTLVALKLRKNNDVGDLQPIELTMADTDEACIPIRMTAIAAQADMEITAIVLSNEGRAIPENFLHVTLNEARIDWLRGGSNYRSIVGEAADEGGGNAFTTEFSGSTAIFKDRIYADGQYDLASLRGAVYVDDFLRALGNQGFFARTETAGILARTISESALREAGIDAASFANCPQCFVGAFRGARLDPNAAIDELDERIVQPERRAQAFFDHFSTVTRLYTLISPEEMNVDPVFAYRASLPTIDNQHNAKMILHCGLGGAPGSAGVSVILESGANISYDSRGNSDTTILSSMPAAAMIEDLGQGLVVQDNTDRIADLLDENNARSSGCSCGVVKETARTGLGGLSAGLLSALVFGALVLRRKR